MSYSGRTRPLMNLLLLWAMSCLTQGRLFRGGAVSCAFRDFGIFGSRDNIDWQWLYKKNHIYIVWWLDPLLCWKIWCNSDATQFSFQFQACGVRLGLGAARGLPGVSTTPGGSTRRPAGGDVQGANSRKIFSRVLTVLTLRFCRGSCCVQDMLWPHFPQFDSLLSLCKSRCPTDDPTRQTQMSKWAAEVQCHVHCCPVGKEFSGQECCEIFSACDFPTFGFAILCFTWTKGWYSPKFP